VSGDRLTSNFPLYGRTPEWLLDAEISDRAKVLFAILDRYGDTAFPKRTTLAKRLRCSASSVDRAIEELKEIGALTVEARFNGKGRTSNLYTLHAVVVMGDEGVVVTGDEAGTRASKPNEGESEPSVPSLAVQGDYDPTKLTKIDGRNLPYDALASVTQADPDAEGGRIATALKIIRPLAVRDLGLATMGHYGAEWIERQIANEIANRADMYVRRWPNVELTPTALASNWTRVTTPEPGEITRDSLQRTHDAVQRGIDAARGGRE
jgi:hypothetical protein